MLLACNPRKCHRRRQTVSKEFCQRARILVREHTGRRPRERCVLRWERTPSVEKSSRTVSCQWPLPPRNCSQGESNGGAIFFPPPAPQPRPPPPPPVCRTPPPQKNTHRRPPGIKCENGIHTSSPYIS